MRRSTKLQLALMAISCFFIESCATKKGAFFSMTESAYFAKTKTESKDLAETPAQSEKLNAETLHAIKAVKKESNTQQSNNAKKSEITQAAQNTMLNSMAINNDVVKKDKETKKEAKRELKKLLKQSSTARTGIGTLILVILAIILPPLAVVLVDGLSGPFWLSILLTILFYVPGLIYALWRVFRAE